MFSFGLCLAMQVIGDSIILGVLLGIIGAIGMIDAYTVFCLVSQKRRTEYAPRNFRLTDELMIK